MAKFRVYQDADYVMGHLRYGHREGIIEADSREDALDKLKNKGYTDYLDLVVDDFAVEDVYYGYNEFEIEEIVEETPEKNNGWIPVEELMPEKNKTVLVCQRRGAIEVAWHDGHRWKAGFSHAEWLCDVVAWRPMPEPYKAERSNNA